MRAIATVAIIAVMATAALAAVDCGTAPANDVLAPRADCAPLVTCGTSFCACVGGTGSDPAACVSNQTSCTTAAMCTDLYLDCALTIEANASAPCQAFAATLAAASPAVLATSCSHQACSILSRTSCYSAGLCATLGFTTLAPVTTTTTAAANTTTTAANTTTTAIADTTTTAPQASASPDNAAPAVSVLAAAGAAAVALALAL